MTMPVTFPLMVRWQRDGNCAVLRPEPPVPGSQAFTRVERIVARMPSEIDHVIFDMGCYRCFDSQNLAVIVALVLRLVQHGIGRFSMINVPPRGWNMLAVLGLDRYFPVGSTAA